jgi:rhamnose utilization protein RhaD (predicted bifunctional aldolase and dehydrogenase)|uniref:class II aldolase/adducin family protein n=1 Tax=Orrella sp. TaxID=1921583 RepID=UPI0040474022
MIYPESTVGRDVRKYCTEIGADPLWVQGAGGNVSWKEDSTLWVKASGTWLSNAEKEEIFIPVDLMGIKSEIAKKNFSVAPKVVSDVKLKPSIETMLHALMPHRVVIHLHAIEILAHLVRRDFEKYFSSVVDKTFRFSVVDYYKPGSELALAIDVTLKKCPLTDVIFLKNHGIVIGGDNVIDVHEKLCKITDSLTTESAVRKTAPVVICKPPKIFLHQYTAVDDPFVHQLALDPLLFSRLNRDWALYPDHVVFLGPTPHVYESWARFEDEALSSDLLPELIFLAGEGVFVQKSITRAKLAQLRCYFDVMVRQTSGHPLIGLTNDQIAELLNWDAEQYRMSLAI